MNNFNREEYITKYAARAGATMIGLGGFGPLSGIAAEEGKGWNTAAGATIGATGGTAVAAGTVWPAMKANFRDLSRTMEKITDLEKMDKPLGKALKKHLKLTGAAIGLAALGGGIGAWVGHGPNSIKKKASTGEDVSRAGIAGVVGGAAGNIAGMNVYNKAMVTKAEGRLSRAKEGLTKAHKAMAKLDKKANLKGSSPRIERAKSYWKNQTPGLEDNLKKARNVSERVSEGSVVLSKKVRRKGAALGALLAAGASVGLSYANRDKK